MLSIAEHTEQLRDIRDGLSVCWLHLYILMVKYGQIEHRVANERIGRNTQA